ncbi:class I SAM-dependent methyltransferase [uncultured Photobacterium sp.]|uniref:class I SAM-dependent methyltransferase n=1 Tax=uncultured Photobacterium sp. TaxID=173973 RepID=UPI0026300F46|nr:class I SAM-dependent methyltransferase [uncultured Photobacterium sp.]
MNDLELLIKLHITQYRQGPGGKEETLLAARLAGLSSEQPFNIADIGCGTGASTIELVTHFDCSIQAVDFLPEFIETLKCRAVQAQVGDKITPIVGNMEDLPFEEEFFDVLWSEGAIYNMGFEKGISEWRKYLKPGGKLVVSELTWLTEERPEEITRHWASEYPEVAPAAVKITQLEKHGYKLLGYFPLGIHCWLENYYQPLQARFVSFMAEHLDRPEAAKALVEEHLAEIDLYEKYKDFVSYGFYIAEKV